MILLAASIALATVTAGAPLHGPLPAPTPEPTATSAAPPEAFNTDPGQVVVFSLPLSCIFGLLILIGATIAVLLAPRFLKAGGNADPAAGDASEDPET